MSSSINTLFQNAVALHQEGQLERAKQHYLHVLEDDPQHAAAMHLLGMLAAQSNQGFEAVSWIEKAIIIQPDNALFHNNLGNAYKGLHEFEKAKTAYQQALNLDPNYAEAHNNIGTLFYLRRDLDAALKHYQLAIHCKPDYVEAHKNLGLLFLMWEKIDEAIKQYQNVVELKPQSVQAHYQLANLYLQKEQLDKAQAEYETVLSYHPEHLDSLNNLGVICLKRKHAQQAIDYFTQVLALDIEHLDARSNIAATFMQYDRYQHAMTHYHKLLELDPNNIDAHYNMGVALMSLGQLDEAIQHYQQVLSLEPDHFNAHSNLGTIYMRQQKKQQAIQQFKTALSLQENNQAIRYMLAALRGEQKTQQAPIEYISNLFDNYAMLYDKHLKETLHYAVPQALKDAICKILTPDQHSLHILDLGCGTGLSGIPFKELAKELIGVDLSEKMLEQAKEKKIYDQLLCSDIHTFLEQNTRQYDVIIAADVLSYIGDLKEIFTHCLTRLKPNGLLTFSVEKLESEEDYRLQQTARFAHSEHYIQKMAKNTGYRIEKQDTMTARQQNGKPVFALIFVLCRAFPL